MLKSMTAFGNAQAPWQGGELTVEIRCVNHRYLDVTVRAPEELRAIESEVRQLVGKKISRGKLECALRLDNRNRAGTADLSVNPEAASKVIDALKDVAREIGYDDGYKPDPARVLGWPGVLTPEPVDLDNLHTVARDAVKRALASVVSNREREGQAIADLLASRASDIGDIVEALRVRRPQVVAHQRQRLASRLADFDTPLDPGRLEQEILIAAQKLDIDEELDRLATHVSEFNRVLAQSEPVGRRLDFLMQEFNREANTVGSKSGDSDTTALAVDMKVLIEQMREQVQNIE